MLTIRDLSLRLAVLAALLALGACETPVSLKEPRRAAPQPVPSSGQLPAPAPTWPTTAPLPQSPLPSSSLPGAAPPAGAQPLPVPPVPSAAMPEPAAPTAAAAVEPPLLAEQRWLTQWFAGTPVLVAMQGDGGLRVEVPLEYSFDPGVSVVKPPLAAVLDRVATSARRVEARVRVEAPSDADGAQTQRLAIDRAASMRQHLTARGLGPQRLIDVPLGRAAVVALQLSVAAP